MDAPWFAVPDFVFPEWNLQAIFFIVPVAIAPAIEHFGDILAIGNVTGKDFVKEPGHSPHHDGRRHRHVFRLFAGGATQHHLQRGDRCGDPHPDVQPRHHDLGGHFRHRPGLCRKMGALLQTIPVPVMGGIMLLLFGAITVVGLNTLVKAGEDLTEPRNLTIVALILVCGIGGMVLSFGKFTWAASALSGILG
jgi:uracil permease